MDYQFSSYKYEAINIDFNFTDNTKSIIEKKKKKKKEFASVTINI